jgi:hypothetical protein
MDDELSEVSTGLEDDDEPMGAFGWDLAQETAQRFTQAPAVKMPQGSFCCALNLPRGPRSLC